MALDDKGVVSGDMGGKKLLRRFRRFEPQHSSLAPAGRKTGILRPIVLPATKIMILGKPQMALSDKGELVKHLVAAHQHRHTG